MRGQLISADVVVAIAIAAIAAGLVLNAVELSLSAAEKHASLSSTLADVVAAGIAEGVNVTKPYHCSQFNSSNATCAGFKCPLDTFEAMRFIPCENDPPYCVLEVRTCN